jgi:hypothetical protein
MKIAKVTIEGENGERIQLDKTPLCTLGNCLNRGNDDSIYARCPQCERWTCEGHWQEEAALCLDCAHQQKP